MPLCSVGCILDLWYQAARSGRFCLKVHRVAGQLRCWLQATLSEGECVISCESDDDCPLGQACDIEAGRCVLPSP